MQNQYHALDDHSTQGIQNPLMGGKMAEELLMIYCPSRILRLSNIATLMDTKDNNTFTDLYSDIMDMCSKYGKVMEIKIPRPLWVDRIEQNTKEDAEKELMEQQLKDAEKEKNKEKENKDGDKVENKNNEE
jgi:hypothetical protein